MASAMEGGGRYNANASAQAASSRFGLNQIRAAARTAPLGPTGAVTVVDYGASEGLNSLATIGAAVQVIRSTRGDEQPVWVFHTDLPPTISPRCFTPSPTTRTATSGRVCTRRRSAGRSMTKLLPDGTVSLGWSSIAVHWLSAVPGPLDGFWFSTAAADQYTAWAQTAAADWDSFVRATACEMLPEARLVVAGAAHGDGPTRRSGAERAMDQIACGLQWLVEDGVITDAERAAMTIPAWYRTAAEWQAPFNDDIGLEG